MSIEAFVSLFVETNSLIPKDVSSVILDPIQYQVFIWIRSY